MLSSETRTHDQQGRGWQLEALLNTVLPLPPVSIPIKLVSASKGQTDEIHPPKIKHSWNAYVFFQLRQTSTPPSIKKKAFLSTST